MKILENDMNLFVQNEYKPHDMVMVNNDVLSYYYDKENGQDYFEKFSVSQVFRIRFWINRKTSYGNKFTVICLSCSILQPYSSVLSTTKRLILLWINICIK